MDWSGVSRTLGTHAKAVAAPTASMAESSPGCLSVPDLQHRQASKRHERRWVDAEPEESEGQDGERRPAQNNREWRWIIMTKRGHRFLCRSDHDAGAGHRFGISGRRRTGRLGAGETARSARVQSDFADGSQFREVNLRADKGVITARLALLKMEQEEGSRLFGIAKRNRVGRADAAEQSDRRPSPDQLGCSHGLH